MRMVPKAVDVASCVGATCPLSHGLDGLCARAFAVVGAEEGLPHADRSRRHLHELVVRDPPERLVERQLARHGQEFEEFGG